MNKILVPVDLSVPSSWGFYYAYDLAEAMNAEIIVIHMYLPHTETSLFHEQVKFLKNQSHEEASKRKAEILEHLKAATQPPITQKKQAVKVTYVLDYGEKNEIAHYAKIHQADLIVMGTHGLGNNTDSIWGSNTNKLIQNTEFPVLAVPAGATFKKGGKIAYATDYSSTDIENIYQLSKIAAATNSDLHCVHVNLYSGPAHTDAEETFKEKIKDSFQTTNISFSTWSANNVEDGLDIFCRINDIDILATLTKDKSTWENLFGAKSLTQSMKNLNRLPLFAFHE